MNALGGIGYSSYELYTRNYQSALEADVSSVSQREAENGAAMSDTVRLAAKEQSKDERALPLASQLKRAVSFTQNAKKEAGQKEQSQESCPIAQARAESAVGENAPLNWLVADQMGGQAAPPQREDFLVEKPELSFQDPSAVFVTDPDKDVTSGGTLLSQEWLLSPCA